MEGQSHAEWKVTWWGSQNKANNSFCEFNSCLITWLRSLSNIWHEHFQCCCSSLMLFQCFCCILLFLLLSAGKAEICAGPAVVATQHRLILCARGGSHQLPPQWSCWNQGRINSVLLVCLVWGKRGGFLLGFFFFIPWQLRGAGKLNSGILLFKFCIHIFPLFHNIQVPTWFLFLPLICSTKFLQQLHQSPQDVALFGKRVPLSLWLWSEFNFSSIMLTLKVLRQSVPLGGRWMME